MATKTQKIPFKAGDDFILTLTVSNKTSDAAVAAITAVAEAQAAYDAQVLLNDQSSEGQIHLTNLFNTLNTAKDTYDEAIIVDITDWVITSSMRWITKLMANFTVDKVDAVTGKFTLECSSEETQSWKPRVYDVDVQFIIDGKKSSSQTFQIDVKKDVTFEEEI